MLLRRISVEHVISSLLYIKLDSIRPTKCLLISSTLLNPIVTRTLDYTIPRQLEAEVRAVEYIFHEYQRPASMGTGCSTNIYYVHTPAHLV